MVPEQGWVQAPGLEQVKAPEPVQDSVQETEQVQDLVQAPHPGAGLPPAM